MWITRTKELFALINISINYKWFIMGIWVASNCNFTTCLCHVFMWGSHLDDCYNECTLMTPDFCQSGPNYSENCNHGFPGIFCCFCTATFKRALNTWRVEWYNWHFADYILDAFSWVRIVIFWLKFQWNLPLGVQLTISEHWIRWWVVLLCNNPFPVQMLTNSHDIIWNL